MRYRQVVTAVLMAMVCEWGVRGAEIATPDLKPLIADLAKGDASVREKALETLKAMPESALPAINAAIEDPATPAFARGDLEITLPKLFERWRAVRKAADARLDMALGPQAALESYRQVGKKDARWDDRVAAGFAAEAQAVGKGFNDFKAAVEAGCTDPLVRYFYCLRGHQRKLLQPAVTLPGLRDAARDMEASDYPVQRKFYAYLRFTVFASDVTVAGAAVKRAEVAGGFDKCLALLPAFVTAGTDRASVKEAGEHLMAAGKALLADPKVAFDRVYPVFKGALPGSPYPQALAAEFYVKWAWEARGGGWANTVTDDGWRLFAERLDKAEKAAEEGWALDPLDPDCSRVMVTVCMGKGLDRDVMERWFGRAMQADPDCLAACAAKLNYLYPKWHGSAAETVAFARECIENGSAGSRIPLLAVDAHVELAQRSEDEAAYWASPAVWRDVRAAYEKVLKAEAGGPNLLLDRARYLKYAMECRQWQAFLDLSKAFGSEIDMKAIGGKDLYAFYQKKARQELAKP
jgi:hypothetical protein